VATATGRSTEGIEMTLILMAAWLAAAVVLWRRANEDDASGWLRFAALVIVAPLAMLVIASKLSKARRR
jgi:hypothetical protein